MAADLVADLASPLTRKIEFHPAMNPATPAVGAPSEKRSDGGEFYEHRLDPELSFRINFRRIGAGLANLGNTCFLNSVLQCLTYTEPFAAYLQSGKHKSSCHTAGFCAMCALQNHVMNALQSTGKILTPSHLVKNLRSISRSFRNSRQEDAHEYMVNLLESMHKCCLPSGVPSESSSAYEKSLVHKIFGGRLRSQVKCMQCSYCSDKFDPFLDLSLELEKADSLLKALGHFTAVEQLDGGERQYQCQRCKKKVRALKQLTVHNPPDVLTIHLKRFSSHIPGQKIDKKVDFELILDLKPFVSGPYKGNLKYTLYGVLVHAGWSTHSGHYYCFVRTSNGMWHSLNDNQVRQVSENTVLAQKAYMLFYVRDRSSTSKRGDIHKDSISADDLKKMVLSQSPSGLNGSSQNISMDSKLSASKSISAKSKTDLPCHGRSIFVAENSSQHNVPKETSFLQSNGHINQKDASILESSGDVFPRGLQQITLLEDPAKLSSSKDLIKKEPLCSPKISEYLAQKVQFKDDIDVVSHADDASLIPVGGRISFGKLHISGDCNAELEFNNLVVQRNNPATLSPSPENYSKKLLIENGMHMSIGLKNEKCACKLLWQNGGECFQKLEKSEPINLSVKPIASAIQKDGRELTGTEKPVNNHCHRKSKHKKLVKGSYVRGLFFGRNKLFLTSLRLQKNQKHKTCKKRRVCSRNVVTREVVKDHDQRTSEVVKVIGDSTCYLKNHSHSKSNSGREVKNDLKNADCDSIISKDRIMDGRSCSNSAMLATFDQSKRCSRSIYNHCDALEMNVHAEGQSQHGSVSCLIRGSKEKTVAQWDHKGLQSSKKPDVQDGSIGYGLDEWDEEYDVGKRKKKKVKKSEHSFGGLDPFLETAKIKAQKGMKLKMDRGSGNQPFRI